MGIDSLEQSQADPDVHSHDVEVRYEPAVADGDEDGADTQGEDF